MWLSGCYLLAEVGRALAVVGVGRRRELAARVGSPGRPWLAGADDWVVLHSKATHDYPPVWL